MQTDAAPAALMRAIVLTGHGGIDRLVPRAMPTPQARPDEVLVRLGACGLNNTDINTRTGWYGRKVETSVSEELGLRARADDAASSWNKGSVDFPRIQGAAVAGHIAAVGADVDPARVGQRVLIDPSVRDPRRPLRAQLVEYLGSERDGGFAEFVAVPDVNAHSITTTLSDAELATFPCSYDTAEEMLVRADLGDGETILVTGAAGGVGTALIQLALVCGARVVAVAGEQKRERILTPGAHHFVPRDRADLQASAEALVGEQAVDVVADVVGGKLFDPLLKVLRRGGRYTTSGAIWGPTTAMDLRELIYKDREMHGITNRRRTPLLASSNLSSRVASRRCSKPRIRSPSFVRPQEQLLKRAHVGKFVVVP